MTPAPIVAAAAAKPASEVVQGVVKVLSTDILVVKHRFYRRIRLRVPTGEFTKAGRERYATVERLEPIDLEAHVNPVGIGVLALGATITGFFLAGRIRVASPFGGAVDLYKGPFADWLDDWIRKTREERAAEEGRGGPSECEDLHARYVQLLSLGAPVELLRLVWDKAKRLGCAWTDRQPRP